MFTHVGRARIYLNWIHPGDITLEENGSWWRTKAPKYVLVDSYRPGQKYFGQTPKKAMLAAGIYVPDDLSTNPFFDKGGEAEQWFMRWESDRSRRIRKPRSTMGGCSCSGRRRR